MRFKRQTHRAFLMAFLALAVAAAPGLAWAGALDDARAAGQLGERYDGYLGMVKDGVPDSVKDLAKSINTKRKAHYAKIAAKDGTPVSTVAAIAGTKLVKNAPSGQYVMQAADSGWKRVP